MESILKPESVKVLHQLQRKVKSLNALYRLLSLVESALMLTVSVFLALVLGIALQIVFSPPRWLSVGFFLIEATALGVVLKRLVIPSLRHNRIGTSDFPLQIERTIPELQDRLASAIALGNVAISIPEGAPAGSIRCDPRAFSLEMLNALYLDTKKSVSQHILSKVLLRRRTMFLAVFLIAGLAISTQTHRWTPYTFADMINIYLNPLLKSPFTQRARYVVEPGDVEIYSGDDVHVRVTMLDDTTGRPVIAFRTGTEDWDKAALEPGQQSREFGYTFSKVARSMQYQVSHQGDRSLVYKVTVVSRPRLMHIEAVYRFPDYLKKGTVIGEQGKGDLYAPWGSRVQVRTQFDRTLSSARLDVFQSQMSADAVDEDGALGDDDSESFSVPSQMLLGSPTDSYLLRLEGDVWIADFTLRYPGFYRLIAVERDFGKESEPIIYRIAIQPNHVPQVDILSPAGDVSGLDKTELQVVFSVKDDFGVNQVELIYSIEGDGEAQRIRVGDYPWETNIESRYVWNILPFKARKKPVTFYLEAFDLIPSEDQRPENWLRPESGQSDVRRIVWESIAVEQDLSITEQPEVEAAEPKDAAAERSLRMLVQAESGLDEIKEGLRQVDSSTTLTQQEKENATEQLLMRQKEIEKTLRQIKKDIEALAKQTSQQSASASGTGSETSPSKQVTSATEAVGSVTQEFSKQTASTVSEATEIWEQRSSPGDSEGDKPAMGEALKQIANELGDQERVISEQQISLKPGVSKKMEQVAEEIKQGRLSQAAGRTEQIQQQLENLQQRLASASGLEEELEDLKQEQRDRMDEVREEAKSSSASNTAMTDPGSGGSEEVGDAEVNGPRFRLEGFKMEFSGIGDVEERGDSAFQGLDDLRAWEDEKVPAQYKSVVKRYFESLSSREK